MPRSSRLGASRFLEKPGRLDDVTARPSTSSLTPACSSSSSTAFGGVCSYPMVKSFVLRAMSHSGLSLLAEGYVLPHPGAITAILPQAPGVAAASALSHSPVAQEPVNRPRKGRQDGPVWPVVRGN